MQSSSSSPCSNIIKVEVIEKAIQELLLQEEDNEKAIISNSIINNEDEEEYSSRRNRHRLLTRLLSQLDTLRADETMEQQQPISSSETKDVCYSANKVLGENLNKVGEADNCEVDNKKIVEELRKVKRQNLITHCLLGVLILLTIGWQVSEVSLFLMVKDGMRHPFRSLGSIVKGMLNGGGPKKTSVEDEGKHSSSCSTKEMLIGGASSLPGLKIPELPHMELPTLNSSNE